MATCHCAIISCSLIAFAGRFAALAVPLAFGLAAAFGTTLDLALAFVLDLVLGRAAFFFTAIVVPPMSV
jgi:hypothetical protein